MSDSSSGPDWAPPGDATGEPSADPTPREETTAFSTEATQRIARDDPPPPPPPPTATGGWAPPPPPGIERAYGPGGWQPPERPRRRTGLVVGIVIGVVALVVLLGAAAVLVVRSVDVSADVSTGTGGGPGIGQATPIEPQDVPADDLEAQAEAVLRTINTSEERMIAFQVVVSDGLGEDGTVGDAAAEIAQAAQSAGDDLTEIRSDLRGLAGGEGRGFDGLREVRDTYAAHMDAWIEYVDAIAGSPALAAPDSSDAQPLWDEIERSADDFVQAMSSSLPDGLSPDLEQLARFIVERGFGGVGDGPTGDVV